MALITLLDTPLLKFFIEMRIMSRTKLLLLSDSPSATSGLGRITRDLATRIHENLSETFEVATAGFGGPGSSKFNWIDYHITQTPTWEVPELPLIAKDFAGDEPLTLFTIWDASRLGWLVDQNQTTMPHIRRWLADENTKITKMGYFPVDAEGPNGKLSVKLANTLRGFDRVLNYTKWSAGVTGYPDHLPHGIDTDVFTPKDKNWSKRKLRQGGFQGLKDSSFLVGIIATNQARKDWALGIQTCRILSDRGLDVKVWCHIDAIERYWDLYALIVDYNLQGKVFITTSNFSDEQMATFYSACDVTLGIGMGEGVGYPLLESLACGTPVLHGDYAGGAELIPSRNLVGVESWRYEGPYCNKRPVFDPHDWADRVEQVAKLEAKLPEELDWKNLWENWRRWLVSGIE